MVGTELKVNLSGTEAVDGFVEEKTPRVGGVSLFPAFLPDF